MQPKLSSDKNLIKYFFEPDSSYTQGNETAPQSKEILSKLLVERLYLVRHEINEIEGQLAERQKLTQILDSELDERLCQVQSVIYWLELDMCNKIDKSRRRTSLENQIAQLYKEKRQGKLSHWQDTVKLKTELRKAEKELRSASLDLWMMRFLS